MPTTRWLESCSTYRAVWKGSLRLLVSLFYTDNNQLAGSAAEQYHWWLFYPGFELASRICLVGLVKLDDTITLRYIMHQSSSNSDYIKAYLTCGQLFWSVRATCNAFKLLWVAKDGEGLFYLYTL